MLLAAWRAATWMAAPLVRRYLAHRLERGQEHPERWQERLGLDPTARPDGPLAWLHAVSVGEALSILPLLAGLRERWPGVTLLVTTGTVSSATLMEQRLPQGVLHRFAPVDLPDVVERFLNRWRPNLVLFVESEIWPNIFASLERRAVPIVLVNARLGRSAFGRWRWVKPVIRRLLRPVVLVLAQSRLDAERFTILGARNVQLPGNLKYAAAPLPADPVLLEQSLAAVADRPVWLAASTHPGEEELVGRVHEALRRTFPDLLTIIAPRLPQRGPTILAGLRAAGLPAVLRSADHSLPAGGLYVADTLGELGLFYRICPLVFVGGSLVRHGGQNPLEPARLGCALLFGPHLWNFEEIADGLRGAGAATDVADEAALSDELRRLLRDVVMVRRMGQAAARFADEHAGVLSRTLDRLAPLMPSPR